MKETKNTRKPIYVLEYSNYICSNVESVKMCAAINKIVISLISYQNMKVITALFILAKNNTDNL